MSRRGAASLDMGIHRLLSLAVTQPLGELVSRLNEFRPDFLNLYPSTAGLLADEQLAGRLRLDLTGLSTSSEPLTPTLRERLERAFGVSPTDFYATTEGLWGNECEAGSMHLFDDMCIVENVDEDGAPVPAGEIGSRLLVTNLFNPVQPLIRFELTDLVAIEPDPCPCGRTLIRLRSLEGRAEDVLRLGGVTVHPLQFAVVTADPDVREFQVVQEGEALRLRVALRDGSDGAEERLGQGVRAPCRARCRAARGECRASGCPRALAGRKAPDGRRGALVHERGHGGRRRSHEDAVAHLVQLQRGQLHQQRLPALVAQAVEHVVAAELACDHLGVPLPSALSSSCSGRTATCTEPLAGARRSKTPSSVSTPPPRATPDSTFTSPTNWAAQRVAGSPYTSTGGPT